MFNGQDQVGTIFSIYTVAALLLRYFLSRYKSLQDII